MPRTTGTRQPSPRAEARAGPLPGSLRDSSCGARNPVTDPARKGLTWGVTAPRGDARMGGGALFPLLSTYCVTSAAGRYLPHCCTATLPGKVGEKGQGRVGPRAIKATLPYSSHLTQEVGLVVDFLRRRGGLAQCFSL